MISSARASTGGGIGEVEGLRGLYIDRELDLGRLLDRKIHGLGAFEDPSGNAAGGLNMSARLGP
jgi:hypothetical protein